MNLRLIGQSLYAKEVLKLNSDIEKVLLSFNNKYKYFPSIGAGIICLKKPNLLDTENIYKLDFGQAVIGCKINGKDNNKSNISDKYHIGSCGKAFTSLILYDIISDSSNNLSWESKIGDFISSCNDNWKNISISDLVSHKAGINDSIVLNGARQDSLGYFIDKINYLYYGMVNGQHKLINNIWDPYITIDRENSHLNINDYVKITRYNLLNNILETYKPETSLIGKFKYSNVGYSLASYLIELYLNKPYEELINDILVDKIGMRSLGFGSPCNTQDPNNPSSPWGHINSSWFSVNNQPIHPNEDKMPSIIQPAGNMHCTIEDWMKSLSTNLVLARNIAPNLPFLSNVNIRKNVGYGGGWIISKVPKESKLHKVSEDIYQSNDINHNIILSHDGSNSRWYSKCIINVNSGIGIGVVTNTFHLRAAFVIQKLIRQLYSLAKKV